MNTADYVTEITVIDPDTLAPVEVAIYKDRESGGMFGVDCSYTLSLSEGVSPINNPFNGNEIELVGD